MDFWIPLLGGAFGAAIVNGVLAVYKLRHDVELEHRQWGRNQRQEIYVAYLSAVSEARTALDAAYVDKANGKEVSRSAVDTAMAAVQKRKPGIFLVAPHMVAAGVREMASALYGLSSAL